MSISGDGFVTLADGTRRWGRFGAAGVLVRCPGGDGGGCGDGDPSWWYFLARRSEWCHQGGCWAIPGGALHRGESPVEGALREFVEEVGAVLREDEFSVVEVHEDDHGGWSYWTVVVEVPSRFDAPRPMNWETDETAWVADNQLSGLDLLAVFRAMLVRLGVLGVDR
jgi:8-oxo-dGTP diphosphatase